MHLKDGKAAFVYAEIRPYMRGFSPLTSVLSVTNKQVIFSCPEQTCRHVPAAGFCDLIENSLHVTDAVYAHMAPMQQPEETLSQYREMNALRYFSVKGVLVYIPELDEAVFIELHAHEDNHNDMEETVEEATSDNTHFLYGRMVRNKYASPLLKEFSFTRREINAVHRPHGNNMLGLIGKLVTTSRQGSNDTFEALFMQLSNDRLRELMQKRMRQKERDGDVQLSHWVQGFFTWLQKNKTELDLSQAQSLQDLTLSPSFPHEDHITRASGRWTRTADIEEFVEACMKDPQSRPSARIALHMCADLMRSMTLF